MTPQKLPQNMQEQPPLEDITITARQGGITSSDELDHYEAPIQELETVPQILQQPNQQTGENESGMSQEEHGKEEEEEEEEEEQEEEEQEEEDDDDDEDDDRVRPNDTCQGAQVQMPAEDVDKVESKVQI